MFSSSCSVFYPVECFDCFTFSKDKLRVPYISFFNNFSTKNDRRLKLLKVIKEGHCCGYTPRSTLFKLTLC